ncbi:hypothetical protein CAOG_009340 [Capsaspora owczarzaki ATCC 30864]|uniref:50S ribosomal protein L1 n=1 Tax=Capsaspora owczarzaki (strain ATCC 30864) TaxID=595528 RepID=A0A0D2WJ58_CAPO3|nr:hypothetical protein CAOG_009340 [Capsaspora owczarzaki ATCC 30864]
MLSATLSSVRVGGRSAAGAAAWRSLSTVAVSAPAAAGSDTTADTTTNTSTTTTTSSSSSSASAEGAQAERNKKGIRFEVLQPLSFAQRPLGSVTEAIQAIKAFAVRPQPATVAMTLGIEMRDAKGRMGHPVHAMVALPYVQKKREIILVFARGDDAAIAKAAGATVVGGPELFADITAGKLKYDKVLATTDMLAEVKAVAKYLRQATPTVKKGKSGELF